MDESSVIVRTTDVSRTIGEKRVVDRISVDVLRGETLAIVGPSGSGKSSFLRMLNRLDEPTEGTVYLDGRDYKTIPPQELRRRVGMVLQAANLFPGTVAENLRFGPRQRNETLTDASLERLLEQVGLRGYADRDVANLSGGEAQRVSIARTLANQPEVLLLDEPTSALDSTAERSVERLIRQIAGDSSLTVLIITHDMAQAARLAQRVMVIEGGRMTRLGPVEEVLRAEPVLS